MSESEVRAEWRGKHAFAEYAEALGIRTVQIMAARKEPDQPVVIVYTPENDEADLDPGTPVLIARLDRDADGILRVVGEPIMSESNWADMEAEIERRLREEFGDDNA